MVLKAEKRSDDPISFLGEVDEGGRTGPILGTKPPLLTAAASPPESFYHTRSTVDVKVSYNVMAEGYEGKRRGTSVLCKA
jgi:hypothetical protein